MNDTLPSGAYGVPPTELVARAADAVQFSPLIPGASRLEDVAEATIGRFVMLAPPGTIERRYTLALALRAVFPGGHVVVAAPKDKGGARLAKELTAFGCTPEVASKRHYKVCSTVRPHQLDGLDEALSAGALRLDLSLGLWTQPGIFSWDRLDPGSVLLLDHLPPLAGRGADLGCGIGFLARAALAAPTVSHLTLVDIDRRAIDAATRNVPDPRAVTVWGDVRHGTNLSGLDFVITNPPFHDAGMEDQSLGQAFIRRAAEALRPGGSCWLVANRHLPYEGVMAPLFRRVSLRAEAGGYKVYEAQK